MHNACYPSSNSLATWPTLPALQEREELPRGRPVARRSLHRPRVRTGERRPLPRLVRPRIRPIMFRHSRRILHAKAVPGRSFRVIPFLRVGRASLPAGTRLRRSSWVQWRLLPSSRRCLHLRSAHGRKYRPNRQGLLDPKWRPHRKPHRFSRPLLLRAHPSSAYGAPFCRR